MPNPRSRAVCQPWMLGRSRFLGIRLRNELSRGRRGLWAWNLTPGTADGPITGRDLAPPPLGTNKKVFILVLLVFLRATSCLRRHLLPDRQRKSSIRFPVVFRDALRESVACSPNLEPCRRRSKIQFR